MFSHVCLMLFLLPSVTCGRSLLERSCEALHVLKSHASRPDAAVYRCPGRCGGLGDNLAGVTGAALFALYSKRRIIIDWPWFPDWMESPIAQWHVSEEDSVAFQRKHPTVFSYHEPNPNDHLQLRAMHNVSKTYRYVIVTGHRGVTIEDGAHYFDQDFNKLLKCVVQAMLSLSHTFMRHMVTQHQGSAMSMQHLLATLTDSSIFSVGIHVRVGDSGTVKGLLSLDRMQKCFNKTKEYQEAMSKAHRKVAFLSTNGQPIENVYNALVQTKLFDEVITLMHSVTHHSEWGPISEKATALKEAFTDIVALAHTRVLVQYSPFWGSQPSGFVQTAALMANSNQIQINGWSCGKIEYCSRFC
jgi:hypothetical protein|uniref:Uncharacterized protein n=1 Tax=Eutreptiella gymnastica TaxID=73025 RepID=A0A7S4CXY1_9EUGL|mmetsp:Transcript_6812/g.12857  ORF Transcript_6812/g.12857 Transcript_6812/m.12857 type:complete len:357 (-) Transcript_6812:1112-2182(-)